VALVAVAEGGEGGQVNTAPQWRPMDSAPKKDYQRILAVIPDTGLNLQTNQWEKCDKVTIVSWEDHHDSGDWCEDGSYPCNPTAWMPLPRPPAPVSRPRADKG
jgi:hypothetical protein